MYKYQTFAPRFWAALIDGAVYSAGNVLLYSIVSVLLGSFSEALGVLVFCKIIEVCWFDVYSIVTHAKYGQTWGKKAMDIKLVNYPDESAITYKQAVWRESPVLFFLLIELPIEVAIVIRPDLLEEYSALESMVYIAFAGVVFWLMVEMITMSFNAKGRAVHDFIAGTVVIRTKEQPTEESNGKPSRAERFFNEK